ncbi:MAG TPA: hypothetical protein VHL58_09870 [Thermoanaerobaculia bacterium]|nr:hypothetical protein [Thermoanaerobaculia bacterium]
MDDASDFVLAAIRLYILFELFEGYPSLWQDYLVHHGTEQQLVDDLPFVLWLQEKASPEELAAAFAVLCSVGKRAAWG